MQSQVPLSDATQGVETQLAAGILTHLPTVARTTRQREGEKGFI